MSFIVSLIIGGIMGIVAAIFSHIGNTSGYSNTEKSDNEQAGHSWFGSHGDSGRCNGDCDNCPDHYGYRYGRWYYGHGHQHGCEYGGNGGASGRTHRD